MGSGETKLDNRAGGLPPRGKKTKAKKGPRSAVARVLVNVMRTFMVLFVLAVMSGVIYVGYLWKQVDGMLDNISGEDPVAGEEQQQEKPKPKEKPVTILLFGLDSREATRTLNTDVIMVATLNPEQKQGTLVSIPRDMAMKPSGYRQNKANAFYATARSEGRKKDLNPDRLVKDMFGDVLGVPVDYLVIVNFKTFEDVVDALGGIEVDVDMDMCYIDRADGTEIRLKKGRQVLSGKEALDFVRYRQSSAACGDQRTRESGDLARNERQQQVVKAILDKLVSFGSVTKATSLLKAIEDNVQTDIPKDRIMQLITTYATLSSADLETITLEGSWKSPYIVVPDETMEAAKKALRARIEGAVLPEGVAEEPDADGLESAFAR